DASLLSRRLAQDSLRQRNPAHYHPTLTHHTTHTPFSTQSFITKIRQGPRTHLNIHTDTHIYTETQTYTHLCNTHINTHTHTHTHTHKETHRENPSLDLNGQDMTRIQCVFPKSTERKSALERKS